MRETKSVLEAEIEDHPYLAGRRTDPHRQPDVNIGTTPPTFVAMPSVMSSGKPAKPE